MIVFCLKIKTSSTLKKSHSGRISYCKKNKNYINYTQEKKEKENYDPIKFGKCLNLVKLVFWTKSFLKFSLFFNHIPYYITPSRSIFWFRSDLGFEENFSLKFAQSLPIIPVFLYCFDEEEEKKSSQKRKKFKKMSLDNLKNYLLLKNIKLLIVNKNGTDYIPKMAKKCKSSHIIYSLNTFVPLNHKKEKKFTEKLIRLGVKPLIFIFNPMNIMPVYFYLKKNFVDFSTFYFTKSLACENYFKKNNTEISESLDKRFMDKSFLNFNLYSRAISLKNFPYLNKTENVKFSSKNYCDYNQSNKFLKNIFSEFTFGYRSFLKILNTNKFYPNILLQKIKANSSLKFFFFIKKLTRKKFLNSYIINLFLS